MTNTQKKYQDDEIDLRELFISLWGNKLLILLITAIFGIAGVVYALLAPQFWSAKAIVVAPFPAQLEQLQLRLQNLFFLNSISKANNTEFLAAFSPNQLFLDFLQAFDSFDNKSEFLVRNGYPQQEDMKGGSMQRSLIQRAENISANKKKDELFSTLSFGSDNAQEAEKMLKEYLNFIQNKEIVDKNKLLNDIISNQVSTVSLDYKVQRDETLKRLQEEITRTEFALQVSRSADIEAPVENLNNQSIFSIDLGAKALNEKLNILKEIKNPVLFNRQLADIRLQLDALQAVPREKVSFTSYHFLRSPSEPLSRDKPKRSFLVILATLVGLMLGVMVGLIRTSWLRRE